MQSKRLAVLTYLALASKAGFQRRDVLLAMFWPERGHANARHALRHAVYHLRNVLGQGVLVSRGSEEIGLAQHRLWCDARALEEALGAGRARDALTLYGGEFLAGVFVAGAAAEWEDWVSGMRTRLRAHAAEAAWVVTELAERAGNIATALAAARRAQELEPDDEAGLRRLMCLLAHFGQRAGALQAYGDFARRMRREYQAEPSRETRALAEAIRLEMPLAEFRASSPLSERGPVVLSGRELDTKSPH